MKDNKKITVVIYSGTLGSRPAMFVCVMRQDEIPSDGSAPSAGRILWMRSICGAFSEQRLRIAVRRARRIVNALGALDCV